MSNFSRERVIATALEAGADDRLAYAAKSEVITEYVFTVEQLMAFLALWIVDEKKSPNNE